MTAFEEFGVIPEIAKAIEDMEWFLPTDIQAESIPAILGGGDVLMAAETGSGKTGAFCIPILQIVHETLRDLKSARAKRELSEVPEDPWTLSIFDRTPLLAIDGLRCQAREPKEWHGGRATTGVQGNGRFYYETTVTDEGLCRVGWSTAKASTNIGTDVFSYAYGGTGKSSYNRKFLDYGEPYGIDDVIGCLMDLESSEISFTKNGQSLGVAYTISDDLRNEAFFPSIIMKNAEMLINFGDSEFKHSIPEGFVAISKADENSFAINPNAREDDVQKPNAPQAIVLEPSRELAEQTYEQFEKFKEHLKDPCIREYLLVGGQSAQEQIDEIQKGVDIIIATPGRIDDLIGQGCILLHQCRFFVLDEADAILKQGKEKLIEKMYHKMPKITSDGRRLQMIVCSATLHDFKVKKMADRLLHFPTWVDLKGEDSVPETVHHCVAMIDPQEDIAWMSLRHEIKTDGVHINDNTLAGNQSPQTFSEAVKRLKAVYTVQAIRVHNMDRAIIFCRTKIDCDNMENYFNKTDAEELSCVCLHADRSMEERKENLQRFKDKLVKFMICTDVASRGLDIKGLPFMINVTLPDDKANYVHRIGRVGRAERMGLAISLVSTVEEKVWYHGQWCKARETCRNTKIIEDGGCCMWYNEKALLREIENHLYCTIPQIASDLKVPINEFDGKVAYGEKRAKKGSEYADHVDELAPLVKELADLEEQAEKIFNRRFLNDEILTKLKEIEISGELMSPKEIHYKQQRQ